MPHQLIGIAAVMLTTLSVFPIAQECFAQERTMSAQATESSSSQAAEPSKDAPPPMSLQITPTSEHPVIVKLHDNQLSTDKVFALLAAFLGPIVAAGAAVWAVHADLREQRRQAWRAKAASALGMAQTVFHRATITLVKRRIQLFVEADILLAPPENKDGMMKHIELLEWKQQWEHWVGQLEAAMAALSEAAGLATNTAVSNIANSVRTKLATIEALIWICVNSGVIAKKVKAEMSPKELEHGGQERIDTAESEAMADRKRFNQGCEELKTELDRLSQALYGSLT